jgi:hypothetical protein
MKTILLSVVVLFAFGTAMAQSIFSNPITGTNPNTDNPYTIGQVVSPAIAVSGIGRGTGITGSNANNRYNASGWNTAGTDADAYFEFIITPNAGVSINFISFVYTGQVNNATIANFVFRSSADGFTADIGTPAAAGATIDLSATAYQGIASPITFRLYAWGADQASRTFSINDFIFNGVTNVLPVTLEYFEGVKQNDINVLRFKVNCSGSNNNTLTVERSADGSNFSTVNTVVADGLRCLQPFSYTDNHPLPGYNYYRLAMQDENGKTTYSNRIVVLNKATGFEMVNLAPAMVTGNTVLNVSAAQKMQVTVVVTDIAGRVQQKNTYYLTAGSNQLKINCGHLAAGFYQVAVCAADGEIKTVRFVKQ